MKINIKQYDREKDYQRVWHFLVEIYQPGDTFNNWLPPRWEYMHHHPFIWDLDLQKIGIFEEGGKIVGIVHPENNQAVCHFQVRQDYEHLKPLMFDYFEKNFQGISKSTNRLIRGAMVSELDPEMEELAAKRGYERWEDFGEAASIFHLDKPIPKVSLPEGFKLQTLAEDNDLHKMNRVLWRGFDHEGAPPEDEIPGRELMQSSANFHPEHTCVVVTPDGNFVAYSGMYYVDQLKLGMVEPVATDPDFRRMGFGKAVVYECLRIVQAKGAEIAWVGSDLEFYKSIGFETKFTEYPWVKFLD